MTSYSSFALTREAYRNLLDPALAFAAQPSTSYTLHSLGWGSYGAPAPSHDQVMVSLENHVPYDI